MSTIEIIPGMTEVMDYIKKQDEEIKKLNFQVDALDKQATDFCLQKEELKEELNDFVSVFDGNVSMKKMTEENKKLKEENEELKAFSNTQMVAHTKTLKRRNWDAAERKKLREEIEKLKEEIEELKTSIQTTTSYWTDKNELLKEEIKKLKNDLRLCAEGLIPKDLIQRGIVEELKKKNEELHKTINTMASSSATTDLCLEHWIIHEQIDPKLLLGNWEEFYEKDEDGQWREKPKTD